MTTDQGPDAPAAPTSEVATGSAPAPWDDASVLAASTAWSWVPDFARSVRTEEYLVVAYPETFLTPTSARVLDAVGAGRDPRDLVDEVHAVARDLGRDRLWWIVSDTTRPAGLEDELLRRGGAVVERSDVLAFDLSQGEVPDLGVPGDVAVRRVVDRADVLEALLISQLAFGGNEPDDAEVDVNVAEVDTGLADDSGGRVLATVDGRPASTGGWTLAGSVARFWGAGTHPDLRGRGAYRAVLQARLRHVLDAGATLALTHGRVETSSPILRSVGFRRYGEQRQLVVDLT
ncbi:hypothetical protein [Intrasporangium sp. YIM S08009]|uniref:GNAT family N-acetyltransferase n=1 Tax=Intrasporangium zincisolvens TaxID=3080018 RepID=UPI002B05F0F6|nr:hypothetical protein [Intrasporangium sp. YIM S08009]